jgi:hypothetical protein
MKETIALTIVAVTIVFFGGLRDIGLEGLRQVNPNRTCGERK